MTDLSDLEETFSFLDDWEERYRVLIDLGRTLPPMPDSLKTDDRLVPGCTSRVWLVATQDAGSGRWHFEADSDAHIVKGLVALLLLVCQDRTAAEIGAADIAGLFSRLGLDRHLSPSRRNGFFSMVETIRGLAGGLAKG